MSLKKVVGSLISVFAMLTASTPVVQGTANPLDKLSHFEVDCLGSVTPTDPQTANCKGRFIGGDATISINFGTSTPVATAPVVELCDFLSGTATITTGGSGSTLTLQLGGAQCYDATKVGSHALAYYIKSANGGPFNKGGMTRGAGSFSDGFTVNTVTGENILLIHIEGNITNVTEEGDGE
jgi:hypothetical protein